MAYIHDTVAIRRILDHLGPSPPTDKPPPPVSEVVRVPLDEEGRQIVNPLTASAACASLRPPR